MEPSFSESLGNAFLFIMSMTGFILGVAFCYWLGIRTRTRLEKNAGVYDKVEETRLKEKEIRNKLA